MNAGIIAVGSELLTPSRLDTNSLFLTEQLNNLGIEVTGKAIIGDDAVRLAEAVRYAISRADIVILTGGLGPTEDDVTRDAVAAALGRKLIFQEITLEWIQQRFRQMNRRMADINRRQAYVIEGAEPLPNANGTAPGQWIEYSGTFVILLPGPPNEMKPMFLNQCLPRLEKVAPRRFIRTLVYRVAGMPESDLDQLISPVYKKYENPVTTILAAPGDVQIHLRARAETVDQVEALLKEVGSAIERLLGDKIYSRDGTPLEAVVGSMLRTCKATLSVAESCTGGLLAGRVTEVPGSSDYFVGGFLVYTAQIKQEILGVDPALIQTYGVVSEPVARMMALKASERTGSTYALSVTGVAGPSGGSEQAPVGTVCIGVAHPEGCQAERFHFLGDRIRVRTMAVQTALDLLRRRLQGDLKRT